jgi:hypothetical protein
VGEGTVVTGLVEVVVATSGVSFLQEIKKIESKNVMGIMPLIGFMCIANGGF